MIDVIATKFTMRNNPELIFILSAAFRNRGMSLLLVVIENDAPVSGSLMDALEFPLGGMIASA